MFLVDGVFLVSVYGQTAFLFLFFFVLFFNLKRNNKMYELKDPMPK